MKKHDYIKNINLAQLDNYIILVKEEYYTRTASGKSWKSKPDQVDLERVTPDYYYNTCDAIPFFKALGGSERAVFNYTYCGYLVTRITSVSPDKQNKVIRKFWILKTEEEVKRVMEYNG